MFYLVCRLTIRYLIVFFPFPVSLFFFLSSVVGGIATWGYKDLGQMIFLRAVRGRGGSSNSPEIRKESLVVNIHWRATGIWNSLPTFSRSLEIKHSSQKHPRWGLQTSKYEERIDYHLDDSG